MAEKARPAHQGTRQGFIPQEGLRFALNAPLEVFRGEAVLLRLPGNTLKHEIDPVIPPAGPFSPAFQHRQHIGGSGPRAPSEPQRLPLAASLFAGVDGVAHAGLACWARTLIAAQVSAAYFVTCSRYSTLDFLHAACKASIPSSATAVMSVSQLS